VALRGPGRDLLGRHRSSASCARRREDTHTATAGDEIASPRLARPDEAEVAATALRACVVCLDREAAEPAELLTTCAPGRDITRRRGWRAAARIDEEGAATASLRRRAVERGVAISVGALHNRRGQVDPHDTATLDRRRLAEPAGRTTAASTSLTFAASYEPTKFGCVGWIWIQMIFSLPATSLQNLDVLDGFGF
jgi:hypothetical protein